MELRRLVPFGLRVLAVRLRREPEIALLRRTCSSKKSGEPFPHLLAEHVSPLRRKTTTYGEKMQAGKERNAALVAKALDGLVIEPYQLFSYHAVVGNATRRRGFLPGPEMHMGKLVFGVGGGACSVSNMLYWLAIQSGMKITERHRHGLDLFPDHGRTVPFACGATVFYNQADLRFENPLQVPVRLSFEIADDALIGRLSAERDPGYRFQVVERDHRFWSEAGKTFRENRILRRVTLANGQVILEEELAHNFAQVLYDVETEEAL